jgi:hypothetical protein
MRLFRHQKAEIVTTAATVKAIGAAAAEERQERAILVPISVIALCHFGRLPGCSPGEAGVAAIANGPEMSDLIPRGRRPLGAARICCKRGAQ